MNRDGVDLLARLVQRNVDDAAFTTNALLDSYQAQVQTWAEAYIELYQRIDACDVLPRHLAAYLDATAWRHDVAQRVIEDGAS
jgi:hypothetical protein